MSIKAENVFYKYSPKTPFEYQALNDVSFEIKDGSFTAIVGKTGCGKSTLIQQFNGLLIPTKGKISVDNFVISSNKKERTKKLQNLRKKVGIVFQFSENQLFEETIENDVIFGPMNFGVKKEEALKLAHECLSLVGIDESYFKRSPFDLSGGEKRRVSIAGILAMKPDILVLDEPTAGLDPSGTKEILNLFKKINESGITVVLVTHDMDVVFEYANNVIVMNDGKVMEITTPDKLFFDDVEKYSLEMPLLAQCVKELVNKGYKLDLTKIRDLPSLINQIKEHNHE
ncbi:MAG TPA: energy-coupling factor transporter ATPase [Firmicutes bacterium]|nr:energy-coupling factor transporter ATPase [Bacillota bacterium]